MSDPKPAKRPRGNPNFVKGHTLGRPKGSVGKFSLKQLAAIARAGATPLEIAVAIARKDTATLEKFGIRSVTRADMKWAIAQTLPYTARRMPQAVEVADTTPGAGITPEICRFLSPSELDALYTLVKRVEEIKARLARGDQYTETADGRVFTTGTAAVEAQAVIGRAAASAAGI